MINWIIAVIIRQLPPNFIANNAAIFRQKKLSLRVTVRLRVRVRFRDFYYYYKVRVRLRVRVRDIFYKVSNFIPGTVSRTGSWRNWLVLPDICISLI